MKVFINLLKFTGILIIVVYLFAVLPHDFEYLSGKLKCEYVEN
jgi:hypothetical protein